MVNMIVASDENGLIGNGNKLPWTVPEELEYFKRMTLNGVCVMGRKTFDSLRKPLKDRINLVVTHGSLTTEQLMFNHQGYVIETTSILDFLPERYPKKTIWIIGGKTIYQQCLDKGIIDNIYHTTIKGQYEGDVYMPEIKDYNIVGTFRTHPSFVVTKYSK